MRVLVLAVTMVGCADGPNPPVTPQPAITPQAAPRDRKTYAPWMQTDVPAAPVVVPDAGVPEGNFYCTTRPSGSYTRCAETFAACRAFGGTTPCKPADVAYCLSYRSEKNGAVGRDCLAKASECRSFLTQARRTKDFTVSDCWESPTETAGPIVDHIDRTPAVSAPPPPPPTFKWYCEPTDGYGDGFCFLDTQKCANHVEKKVWRNQGCFETDRAACVHAYGKVEKEEIRWCFSTFKACEVMRSAIRKEKADYSKIGKCQSLTPVQWKE